LLAVDAEAGCGICHCRLHGGWNNLKPATLIRDSEERGWHSSGALERALQRQHFAKATPMYDTNADISFLRKILAALVTATLLAERFPASGSCGSCSRMLRWHRSSSPDDRW